MNVIDALVVTLGLDPKQFEKGRKDVDTGMKSLREQSVKTAKEWEEQGKKAAAFFSSVKVELLGLLATFGAATGLKEFIGTSVAGQAALGRMSQNLGVATQKLQAYGVIAEGVGGKAEDATAALGAIAQGVAEAQRGHTEFFQAAAANGVAINGAMSYEQILGKIAARMRELAQHGPQGRQQAFLLAQQMGVGSFAQAMLLPNFDQVVAQAEKLAQRTAQSTQEAMKLQMQWAFFKERITSIMDRVFAKLEPLLERLAQKAADWLDSINWNDVIAKGEKFVQTVNDLVKQFGGWKAVAEVVAAILGAKLLAPLVSIVANVGGLGVNIFRLIGMTAGVEGLGAAFAGLGVSIAAAVAAWAGWKFGSWIYDSFIQGTKIGDEIGKGIATALAALHIPFISDQAQQALDDMNGKDAANHAGDFHPERTAAYKAKQAEAMKYFMSQGWTRAQAAGIVANLAKESSFNAKAVGDGGKAFGIGQWHADRQAAFARYIGHDIQHSTFDEQLAFVNYELTHGEKRAGDRLRKAGSAGIAGIIVSQDYERPADVQGEAVARGRLADEIYLGGVQVGAASVAQAKQSVSNSTSTSTSQTHIGQITVNTKATDAKGIARDMRQELSNNTLIAQADSGLN